MPSSPTGGITLSGKNAEPVRQQVLDALRDAILDLRFEPGHRLVERELMEQLSVSRATVREALRDLASEGLVTIAPNRGAVVAAPTLAEASDIYEARGAIEGLLVKLFTERAVKSQMIKLEAAIEEFAEAAEESSDDPARLLRVKDEFIELIFTGAHSTVLQQLAESLRGRVRLLRIKAISMRDPTNSVAELREILVAIRAGEAEQAAQLYAKHVLGSRARAFAALDDSES